LHSASVAFGDDPIAGAERWLEAAGSRRAQHAALKAELAEIESEGARLDEQLEMAENELAAAERELIASVSGSLAGREAPLVLGSVEPAEVTAAVIKLVAAAGPPLVIGECFAELSPQSCAALLETLGEISRRRQVIVVTEHDAVGRWAMGMGLDGVVWTPAEAEAAQRALRNGQHAAEPATEVVAEPEVVVEPEVAAEVAAPVVAQPPAPSEAEPTEPPRAPKAGTPLFDIDAVEAAEASTQAEDKTAEVRNDIFAVPESREAVDAKVVDPDASRSPESRRSPEPSQAPGPWKGQRRARRKNKHQPPAPPWEGRFDTSRDRELPSTPIRSFPPVPGSEPLAVCVRHNGAITRNRCAVCKQPACDDCLMKPWPRRKAICIECAILEAGVRKKRRLRG
jgi:hypothetical protein